MSLIANITPFVTEHWDDILAVGGLLTGWLWHKARGEKTKTLREILDDVVDQVLASDNIDLDNVKPRAEKYLREALAKRKVTGKVAEALVHEFVEYAAGELARRFQLLQRNLDKMVAAAEKVGTAVAAAQ